MLQLAIRMRAGMKEKRRKINYYYGGILYSFGSRIAAKSLIKIIKPQVI